MVLSTLGVAADVTPSVIETFFSHYIHRKALHNKPTAHISYHEGLRLIRKFLEYASEHTVDDLQAFTGQWVPCPSWVKLDNVMIHDDLLKRSAEAITAQLGPRGIEKVGGKDWWQWRRPDSPLKAEWIEMRQDYNERMAAAGGKTERILLYVHGGAYYFGSVGEHRYQMQRHARKLKARCLAPEYRLAPQFPFPCGLHDCIAAYLYLIEDHDPSTILLAGDSAGGGMVLSMLVTLRDQGIPLPAGAMLLSPWVDLTHSFPSVAGEGKLDYIPPNGFHHRPSLAWPPPNAADLEALETDLQRKKSGSSRGAPSSAGSGLSKQDAAQGFTEGEVPVGKDEISNPANPASAEQPNRRRGNTIPGPAGAIGDELSIEIDGKMITLHDQIQMYTTNQLLNHPLVSPVMQPSLGGLPPLLIQTGGGELLRDEQIYIAHKAAHPTSYLPPDAVLEEYDPNQEIVNKYPPTHVQLQVWDDLCHVPHTLSFTRPAKFMYRGAAQFGAWALAHAQNRAITILDDDNISVISADGSSKRSGRSASTNASNSSLTSTGAMDGAASSSAQAVVRQSAAETGQQSYIYNTTSGAVGKAGDPLPHFRDHMIRQRVDRHGMIYPFPPASDLQCLNLDRNTIGVIKPGPVRKWLAKKRDWDVKYASQKRKVQSRRLKEMREGYSQFSPSEHPPPTALAGRRAKDLEKQKLRHGKSWGMAMWSGWGSKHDAQTVENLQKIERQPTQSVALPQAGKGIASSEDPPADIQRRRLSIPGVVGSFRSRSRDSSRSRSRSRLRNRQPSYRSIRDEGQAGASTPHIIAEETADADAEQAQHPQVYTADAATKVPGSENTYVEASSARPHNGTVAYPFKLAGQHEQSASMTTLDSQTHMQEGVGTAAAVGVGTGAAVAETKEEATQHTEAQTQEVETSTEVQNATTTTTTASATETATATDGTEIGGHIWLNGTDTTQTHQEQTPAPAEAEVAAAAAPAAPASSSTTAEADADADADAARPPSSSSSGADTGSEVPDNADDDDDDFAAVAALVAQHIEQSESEPGSEAGDLRDERDEREREREGERAERPGAQHFVTAREGW